MFNPAFDHIHGLILAHTKPVQPIHVIVRWPDGTEDIGRLVASHVTVADGLRGIGVPKAGAPPAIVEVGGAPVMFGPDGWELEGWTQPKPRHLARCLCPEAAASGAAS